MWLLRSPAAPAIRHVLNWVHRGSARLAIVPLAKPLDGHRMLLDWQLHKAFVFGVYELEVVRAIEQIVRPGWTAVDVGAHIGYYSILLRKLVGPTGRVVAFEPIPENFRALQQNVAMNGYADVRLEARAVAEVTGRRTMLRGSADPLSCVSGLSESGDVRVESAALDDYFAPAEPVSFVKIDVEGAEHRVLLGMRRLLTQQRPHLVVAVHGYAPGHPAEGLLREAGYRLRIVDTWGAEHHLLATPH